MTEIVFSHANGFSFQCYQQFTEQLSPYPVTGIESYGDGEYYPHKSWQPLLKQLEDHLAARKAAGADKFIGIGHSLGGVLTVWAAKKHPELFDMVFVIDPPIFAPLKRLGILVAKTLGVADKVIPPAIKTKNRKGQFKSREEAHEQWKSRRLFKAFTPQCLQDYVNNGLVPSRTGKGFELAIPVSLELQIFVTNPHRHGNLRLPLPFYFFYSEGGETLQKSDQKWLKKASNAAFIPFSAGHMWPMEQPKAVAETIKKLIAKHQG